MKIKYSPDADVLVIQLGEGELFDSRDITEGIIVHLSREGNPLEIEVLDASKVVQKKDIEVSMEAFFQKAGESVNAVVGQG
jgi:uncharacterized protein YuzE